jgi:hypothetical protein
VRWAALIVIVGGGEQKRLLLSMFLCSARLSFSKSRLVGCETFGSDKGRVIGICLLRVCCRRERLSAGAEVSIWRAEFRRHFGSGVRAVFGIC